MEVLYPSRFGGNGEGREGTGCSVSRYRDISSIPVLQDAIQGAGAGSLRSIKFRASDSNVRHSDTLNISDTATTIHKITSPMKMNS